MDYDKAPERSYYDAASERWVNVGCEAEVVSRHDGGLIGCADESVERIAGVNLCGFHSKFAEKLAHEKIDRAVERKREAHEATHPDPLAQLDIDGEEV